MGDSEVEHLMTSECGIKTFVRGILPHPPPYTSPQRGTTPVFCDAGDDAPVDNSHLKRKSSFSRDSCESDESESEILPSSKRQRITVSAMRQLFDKFNLNDPEDVTVSAATPTDTIENVTDKNNELDTTQTTEICTDQLKTTSDIITSNSGSENQLDISNVKNSVNGQQPAKRTCKTESIDVQNGKRQKVDEPNHDSEENVDSESKREDTTSEEAVKANKRQAEINDSDAEGTGENSNKVKRTRKLRRGLRLCTNITCYIEQVLYN